MYCIANKGIGANILKVGTKRRRTKTMIAAEKEEAALKEEALQQRLAKLAEDEEEARNNRAAAEILRDLYAKGLVEQDEKGQVLVPSASKEKN